MGPWGAVALCAVLVLPGCLVPWPARPREQVVPLGVAPHVGTLAWDDSVRLGPYQRSTTALLDLAWPSIVSFQLRTADGTRTDLCFMPAVDAEAYAESGAATCVTYVESGIYLSNRQDGEVALGAGRFAVGAYCGYTMVKSCSAELKVWVRTRAGGPHAEPTFLPPAQELPIVHEGESRPGGSVADLATLPLSHHGRTTYEAEHRIQWRLEALSGTVELCLLPTRDAGHLLAGETADCVNQHRAWAGGPFSPVAAGEFTTHQTQGDAFTVAAWCGDGSDCAGHVTVRKGAVGGQ
jgi:hypothetical protein